MEKRTCKYCNKEFYVYPSSTVKYCCYECSRKAKIKLIEKECPVCHKIFKPRTSKEKYCSFKCAIIGSKKEYPKVKCLNCNKKFELKPGHNTKFCCKECYKKHIATFGQTFREYKNRGKTYEEFYGKEKAIKIKNKQSLHKWSEEDKKKE